MERLILMLNSSSFPPSRPDIFLVTLGDKALEKGFSLLSGLQVDGLRAEMDFSGKSMKAQMRRADKVQARLVLILGEDELARNQIQIRAMDDGSQETVDLDRLLPILSDRLAAI